MVPTGRWRKLSKKLESGNAVQLHHEINKATEEETFFYLYKGHGYTSELELDVDEVMMLVDQERTKRKDDLRKEIDRIKAKAEMEGGKRKSIPKKIQLIVWNRDNAKCVECGSNENLEFDHIIPISKGGSNTARNIQLLCEKCNRSKGGKVGG